MGKRRHNRHESLRRLVAVEAARIMADEGIRDYYQAKTKAADRLGIRNDAELPKNTEIEKALKERLALFDGEENQQHLNRLRDAAVSAMQYFEDFTPRLVGPVLEGTADRHSAVCLHVFADTPEAFRLFLDDRLIPYDLEERQIRVDRERAQTFPAYLFEAGGIAVDITVMPPKALRQPPISPINGRPVKRVSLHGLREMLEEEAEEPGTLQ